MEIPLEIKTQAAEVAVLTTASAEKYEPTYCKSKKLTGDGGAYGTGRRKNSIARVWVRPGNGKFVVNGRELSNYFPRDAYVRLVNSPFVDTNCHGQYDVICTTKGGGTTGQAGAIRHGVARALDCLIPESHSALKSNGHLKRDPRVVERKKYGLRKARKSVQFSKR